MSEMNTTIYWSKVKPDAKIPEKDRENAGYDVYACFEEDFIRISPHETKLISTGIASMCTPNYCFILKERGSTGSKGLAQRCGVIDSGYRGEWFIPLTNTTDKSIIITKEEKFIEYLKGDCIIFPSEKAICQAILVPVPNTEAKIVEYQELLKYVSERGTNRLGSSGK